MRIKNLTPMLYTQDLEGTLQFYIGLLNFSCIELDHTVGWALLQGGGAEIMFCPPNAHLPFEKSTCTGSFYFEVTAVDQWWNQVKEKTTVCYEPENFDHGMREFAIYDNNGYLLQFGEPLDQVL